MEGRVKVDDRTINKKSKLKVGDTISVEIRSFEIPSKPEYIPLNVIYEDYDLIVIDKSAGMVVHPGAGNYDGTLLNALLFHFPENISLPRAGIVHRLDKDTSGLMVIAKNERSYSHLVQLLSDRMIKKMYFTIVQGVSEDHGEINRPIGRDFKNRKKMCVRNDGKVALTCFRKIKSLGRYSLLECEIKTGRTHQIRVHLSSLGLRVLGDKIYGVPNPIVSRQMLHSHHLSFTDLRGEILSFSVDLPEDFRCCLEMLENTT